MTCTTCGAVGAPGSTWCPRCYLPYAPAASRIPPPPPYPPPYLGNDGPPAPRSWSAKLGLVVPQYAVEVGDLPRICVVSGRPTATMARMSWVWSPKWSLLLGLIVRYIIGDKVSGYLPIAPAVRRRHRLIVCGLVVAFVAGFGLLIGGLAAQRPLVTVPGLVLIVGSVIAVGVKGELVKVKRADVGYLAIKNASPEFVAAFRAGRPAGQVPYTNVPAKENVSFQVLGVAGFAAFVVVTAAVVAAMGGTKDSGCGCGPANSGDQPKVVYRQPGGQACNLLGHVDVAPVEAAIDARNAAVAAFGPVPRSKEDIAAVRATDNRLASTVSPWGMISADLLAKDDYLSALTTYDQDLGTAQAPGAAQSLAAQEAAMRQEFATAPGPCTGT